MTHSWREHNIIIPSHMAMLSSYRWWRKLAKRKWQVQSKWWEARSFFAELCFRSSLKWQHTAHNIHLLLEVSRSQFWNCYLGDAANQNKSGIFSTQNKVLNGISCMFSILHELRCLQLKYRDDDTVISAWIIFKFKYHLCNEVWNNTFNYQLAGHFLGGLKALLCLEKGIHYFKSDCNEEAVKKSPILATGVGTVARYCWVLLYLHPETKWTYCNFKMSVQSQFCVGLET